MLLYTTIDRWYLNHNSAEIVDLYYNPDSNAGGQYVENHISYDLIKESYINSEGDTDVFLICLIHNVFSIVSTKVPIYMIGLTIL